MRMYCRSRPRPSSSLSVISSPFQRLTCSATKAAARPLLLPSSSRASRARRMSARRMRRGLRPICAGMRSSSFSICARMREFSAAVSRRVHSVRLCHSCARLRCRAGEAASCALLASRRRCQLAEWRSSPIMRVYWRSNICRRAWSGCAAASARQPSAQSSTLAATQSSTRPTRADLREALSLSQPSGEPLSVFAAHSRRFCSSSTRVLSLCSHVRVWPSRARNRLSCMSRFFSSSMPSASVPPILPPSYCSASSLAAKRAACSGGTVCSRSGRRAQSGGSQMRRTAGSARRRSSFSVGAAR